MIDSEDRGALTLAYLHNEGFVNARVVPDALGYLVALSPQWAGHTGISDTTPSDPLEFAQLQVAAWRRDYGPSVELVVPDGIIVGINERRIEEAIDLSSQETEDSGSGDDESDHATALPQSEVLDYEIDSGVAEKGEAEEIAGDEQAADVSMVSDAGCDGLVMPEAGGELHLRLPAELGANEPSGADAVSEAGGGHAEQVGSEPNLAAYPGVAWEKLSDELSILRAQVIDMISAREEIRLDALVDPSRREDLRQSFIDYQNKGALRLEPSAQDRDLYIQYMDWQAKESTLRTHASALRRSARDADIAILRLMAANVDSNWP